MPIYEYTCPSDHYFEAYQPVSKYEDPVPCRAPGCEQMAKRTIVSLGYWAQTALVSPATVIFKNSDGHVLYPGHDRDATPEGYERIELRTTEEKRNFVKQLNAKDQSEYQRREESRQEHYERLVSENRSDLRNGCTVQVGDELVRMPPLRDWTPAQRDFAMAAIEKTNRRKRGHAPTEHIMSVLEYDSSNRRPHCDSLTGWRDRK